MTKLKNSILEINKKALASNLDFIRKKAGRNVTISSVLKGNAYGHGIEQMVPLLESLGVDHFSVFCSSEARAVHKARESANSTIVIMGDLPLEDLNWVLDQQIECFVFNQNRLDDLALRARKKQKKATIHLELETGMNRTGFSKEEWPELLEKLRKYDPYIEVKGICTHFAGAESISNYLRIQKQRKTFREGVTFFKSGGINPHHIHSSCSAAMLTYPKDITNLVRIGILQYGLWPSQETRVAHLSKENSTADPLKRIISWKSRIMDIKQVKAGSFIGYGTSFLAESDMTIASIPVGYGHGFNRSLSNLGRVLIRGKRISVIGTINMNMFLVDITHCDASIGDVVTLIGNDGNQEITVSHFGDMSQQLNYELLSRIDKDIPRIVV